MTDRVEIIEVGPRDGLQNEKAALSPADRAAFVRAFYDYARANPGGHRQLWTEWLAAQK